MKKETDTRVVAIVVVKNVTPIPQEMEVGDYVKRAREKGDMFKFVLELENGKWLVSDILQENRSNEWETNLKKAKAWADVGWVGLP